MPFEVYVPLRQRGTSIPANHCRIDSSGRAIFRAVDLQTMGIGERVVVLKDQMTQRIALRRPRDDKEPAARVQDVNKTRNRVAVQVKGLITSMGLDPKKCCKEYPFDLKDDLIVIEL